MNVPGCIHDSMVADWGKIYEKLEMIPLTKCALLLIHSRFITVLMNRKINTYVGRSQLQIINNKGTLGIIKIRY